MKRLLSIVLAIALLMSSLVILTNAAMDENDNWIPDNDKWDSVSRDGVVARLAIGSDIHYPAYNAEGKLQYVYSALKQIGGVDAFLISGDITNNGVKDQYKDLMVQVNKYTKNSAVNPSATGNSVGMTILAMGNHDYDDDSAESESLFETYTEQETDALYWVSGIPVIALSPDYKAGTFAGDRYDLSYDVLKSAYDEIDAKGYKGLIIAMAHHRTSDDGSVTTAWSSDMMDLIKAHPNTVIFTGDYHTWMKPTNDFILQDAGFTHVRGGSLGKDYRPADESAFINPTTGQLASPLGITDDSNCSLVLVDIMADGTAKLRRMDVAQGEYWFENEPLTVRPGVLTDYINDTTSDAFKLSYGAGSKAPSMPKGGKVTLTDKENFGSVAVSFPEGVPASELSKDFIAEYRIRIVDSDGNYVMNGDKDYFSVANYRAKGDEGKPWSVTINGLEWDTDYTAEVKMITPYGKSTEWIKSENSVNVGHPETVYPAVPVFDFDYSYGSAEDGAGHKMTTSPTIVKEAEVDGQKAIQLTGLGKTAYSYEFYEDDFKKIRNSFTMEAYFSATNVKDEQCIMGGTWDGSRLGLRLNEGMLSLRSSFMKTPSGNTSTDEVCTEVKANTWYHVVVTYDTDNAKMYIDGNLCAELSGVIGGLTDVAFGEELSEFFSVGSGGYGTDGETMYMMRSCIINKAALYAGCMTVQDVKNAYKVATTAVPFTDVADGWYIDSVEYAYATGLMNGSSTTTFSPSVKTNRAMIVQMLYNLEGKPAVDKSNNPFTDVPDTWYTDAVLWAYQSGVTTGTSATTFSPDALVTREQVAVFLYRYMRDYKKADMGEGADLSAFPDADSISPYTDFAPAMAWANANGIIGGKKNGSDVTLSPLDQAMRSEVAKMFVSFAKKF